MSDTFTPTDRTRVKRANNRAVYDKERLYGVVDAGLLCHVGYVIDGQPYVTPTIHWREGDRLFWHGSSASKMIRAQKEGLPVCVTVSHLDGLVLARSGFHHSVNYRSAMMFGTARAIDDEAEMMRALEVMMEKIVPGRWPDLREANRQEIKGTTVIAMEIDDAAAKIRDGGVADDEEDYALPIWAGVVPVHTVLGEPIDDERLLPGVERPGYLKDISFG